MSGEGHAEEGETRCARHANLREFPRLAGSFWPRAERQRRDPTRPTAVPTTRPSPRGRAAGDSAGPSAPPRRKRKCRGCRGSGRGRSGVRRPSPTSRAGRERASPAPGVRSLGEPGPGATRTWEEPVQGRNPDVVRTRTRDEPESGGNLDLVGTRTGKEPGSGGNSELGGPRTWEEHRPGRNADLGGRGAPVGLGSDRLSSRTTQCLGGFWKNGEMSALSLDVHPECFTSSSPGPVCWKEPKILTESHESRLLNPGRKKQGQAGDRARRPTRVPEGLAGARSGSTAKGTAFPGLAVPNRFLTQSLHLRVSSCSRMVQGRSTFFCFRFCFLPRGISNQTPHTELILLAVSQDPEHLASHRPPRATCAASRTALTTTRSHQRCFSHRARLPRPRPRGKRPSPLKRQSANQ